MIPECGESICERCFDEVKTSMNEAKQYNCRVECCKKLHLMPENGLPDNKYLERMVNQPRTRKRLSEPAKTLKSLIESIQEKIKKSRNFDEQKSINSLCDQLESQVQSAFEKVRGNFEVIENDLLGDIEEYREKSLELWTKQSTQSAELTTQIESCKSKLNSLNNQMVDFSSKWVHYFDSIEVLATESDIDSALSKAREYSSRIEAIEANMSSLALNHELAMFKPKLAFFQEADEWSTEYNLCLVHQRIKGKQNIKI